MIFVLMIEFKNDYWKKLFYKKVEENYNDVITNYFMINIREFNFSVSHHDVKSFCPKEIYGLEDILENIDSYNENKTEAMIF